MDTKSKVYHVEGKVELSAMSAGAVKSETRDIYVASTGAVKSKLVLTLHGFATGH